ncbi:MAG: hypothetical protein VW338_04700 [Rhodospirillaceae bacterium]
MAPPSGLGLGLGLGPRGAGNKPAAPTGLLVTTGAVADDAATGTAVLPLVALDPNLDDSHSFALEANSYFQIADGWIETKASVAALVGTSPAYDVTVTDQTGRSIVVEVTITVTASFDDTADGGLSGATPYYSNGNLVVPKLTAGDGFVRLTGKGGGGGALMIVDIGQGRNFHKLYAGARFQDLAEMKNGGLDAMVGFGWLNESSGDFHIVGLAGDGAGAVSVKEIYGSGAFNGATGNWTIADHGAPTHGASFDVDHWIGIALASTGATYDFRTSAAGAVNTWATDLSANAPDPFASATAPPRFGLAVYVPASSRGPVNLKINLWRENVFQGARTSLTGGQTVTAYANTRINYGGDVDRDTDSYAGTTGRLTVPAALSGRFIEHSMAVDNENDASSNNKILEDRLSGSPYTGNCELYHGGSGNGLAYALSGSGAARNFTTGQYLETFGAIADTTLDDTVRNWHAVHCKPKHFRGGLIAKSGDQTSVTDGTEITFASPSSFGYDHCGMYSANHWVIPSSMNGQRIRFKANTRSSSMTGVHGLKIMRNTTTIAWRFSQAGSGEEYMHVETGPELVSTGQVWKVEVYFSSGSVTFYADVSTWFSYELIEDYIGCQAYQSSAGQSLTGGGGFQKVTLDTFRINVGGWTLSSGDIIVPSGVSKVQILAQGQRPGGSAGYQNLRQLRNGSSFAGQGNGGYDHGSTVFSQAQALSSPEIAVSGGDTLALQVSPENTLAVNQDYHTHLAVWATEHSL